MTQDRKLNYDQTYMNMAIVLAGLSYAERAKVGCLIVSDDGQIISQGFNGMPHHMNNTCEDVECTNHFNDNKCNCGCEDKDVNITRCRGCDYVKLTTKKEVLHAESNAIAKCAKWVASTHNATVYVTLSPCIDCSKQMIQAGIKRVVYHDEYRDLEGVKLLINAGILVQRLIELSNKQIALVTIDDAYFNVINRLKNNENK